MDGLLINLKSLRVLSKETGIVYKLLFSMDSLAIVGSNFFPSGWICRMNELTSLFSNNNQRDLRARWISFHCKTLISIHFFFERKFLRLLFKFWNVETFVDVFFFFVLSKEKFLRDETLFYLKWFFYSGWFHQVDFLNDDRLISHSNWFLANQFNLLNFIFHPTVLFF
jgi:hypothetical protein